MKKTLFLILSALTVNACAFGDIPDSGGQTLQPVPEIPTYTIDEFVKKNAPPSGPPESHAAPVLSITQEENAASNVAVEGVPLGAQNTDLAVKRLREWDQNLSSLKTDFKQTTVFDSADGTAPAEIASSTGRLYFQRPGSLRLDVLDDKGNVANSAVVAKNAKGKKTIYIIDGSDDAPTMDYDEWLSSQPLSALYDFGQYGKLIDSHKVDRVIRDMNGTTIFLLPPDMGYELEIALSNEDFFPKVIKVSSGGVITTATLSNTQKNLKLPADTFAVAKEKNAK